MKNKLILVLTVLFFIISMNNISFADQNNKNNNELSNEKYEVSDETSQNYINKQLEKINISQLEEELKDNELFKNINLKQFAKDLIKGNAKLSDLINRDNLKSLVLDQLTASLKVITMIIVLALLSSILKSLESSFSSGQVTKIVNYIIFITMVTLVLVNFKDVLSIAYKTINSIISIVNIIIPILLSLMAVGGLTTTSATLSPVFVGGASIINIIFKNVIFTLITLAFCVVVVNNLSKNIKLKKFSELLKKANVVIVGGAFTVYLGLVSIQGIYVTSFDKFAVKSAKFAVGSFIPVIGGFVSDSVDLLLSSSILIKNIFGAVGLVLLVGICLIPILKIFSIILVYKIGAAIVEPIGEENISSFMDETAKLMTVILISVLAVLIMFFVTISILTSLSITS
ncbi:MAG: stage III sporulation protein AE [Intestinibacter bartlettii]|uniref:stage III sporulation protein AE n=1 Tax=Intestinibacter bartlettii TaxID=261299 RepID=UPI0026EB297B|nr:stage III sporulation protein AE [Intestinibacter bartlettii]MDO5009605.1 stage III sporulation protein AE [Intestinibacter bartlettii]